MNPATIALSDVVRSLRSPISFADLLGEVRDVLIHERQAATQESIRDAIKESALAGIAAVKNGTRGNGSLTLLVLGEDLAIPLSLARQSDLRAHRRHFSQKQKGLHQ